YHVHIRRSTRIGEQCIVGEKTYIAYDVRIGNRVKINAFVYVCAAVTIEDGVMISAGTIFTNDRFPRATTPDLKQLRPSEPDEHTLPTLVREGATRSRTARSVSFLPPKRRSSSLGSEPPPVGCPPVPTRRPYSR